MCDRWQSLRAPQNGLELSEDTPLEARRVGHSDERSNMQLQHSAEQEDAWHPQRCIPGSF